MLRILIGMSGCGKTYKIQEEIAHKKFDGVTNAKEIYVIEREEYQEYSNIFNGNFVHVLKPSFDLSFLMEKENCEIYIDCVNYEDEFMQKIAHIAARARTHNNDITITFLEALESLSNYEKMIYINADEILIGKCCGASECKIEELLGIKLNPIISDKEFRKIDREKLKVVKKNKTDEISSLECSDKNVSDNNVKDIVQTIICGFINKLKVNKWFWFSILLLFILGITLFCVLASPEIISATITILFRLITLILILIMIISSLPDAKEKVGTSKINKNKRFKIWTHKSDK